MPDRSAGVSWLAASTLLFVASGSVVGCAEPEGNPEAQASDTADGSAGDAGDAASSADGGANADDSSESDSASPGDDEATNEGSATETGASSESADDASESTTDGSDSQDDDASTTGGDGADSDEATSAADESVDDDTADDDAADDESSTGDDGSDTQSDDAGDDAGDDSGDDDGLPDDVPPSVDPPGGLTPEQAPMFVAFGFDDNAYADSNHWFADLVRDRKNPDGSKVRGTFFLTAGYIEDKVATDGGQTAQDVLDSWKTLYEDGHEIANHTWNHDHGRGKSAQWWQDEIERSNALFVEKIGVPARHLKGFRTPFLEYDRATFDALRAVDMLYDCSIEFGYNWWQHDPDDWTTGHSTTDPETGKWYYWPYTLDAGPVAGSSNAAIGESPGMWELPVYTYNQLNGDSVRTITGFDFNMWKVMPTAEEFLEVLKFNFDQRYTGQRSPLTVNVHADYYSEFNPNDDPEFIVKDYLQRRWVLEEFLDYALSHEETRVVPYIDVIRWMRDPVAWDEM